MAIGTVVDVYRRAGDESAETASDERIGSGVVIHDRIIQLDDPAARLLRSSPHRAERIRLTGLSSERSVRRIRPGLVDFEQASLVVAARTTGLTLLPVDGDLVFLELACDGCGTAPCDHDGSGGDGDDCGPPTTQPWYCKIACILDCTC